MKKIVMVFIFVIVVKGAFGQTQPGLYVGDRHQGNMGLVDAIEWISFNVRNGGNYSIVLGQDASIQGISLSYNNMEVSITLKGVGTERKVQFNGSQSRSFFSVGQGVTFILEDGVTLSGRNGGSRVSVAEGGTFIMNGGSIKDSSTSGVSVGDRGNFIMNNGIISGNTATFNGTRRGGGGVSVSGTFTMNGGTISGNSSRNTYNTGNYGGGVFVRGVFTMNGGTISGNSVNDNGWHTTGGGGVYVDSARFTMNGGTITVNAGGGVCLGMGGVTWMGGGDESIFTMHGGTISGNTHFGDGGGVRISGMGNFTMFDGIISKNSAKLGGGVHNINSFTLHGGTISENTATNGGGVHGSITMNGGIISGNTSSGNGGGVHGSITMNGGTISGNIGDLGGGIYTTQFTMNDGIISGNSARYGGGVFGDANASLTKSGSAGIIYGSDAPNSMANTARLGGYAVFVRGIGSRNTTAQKENSLNSQQEGIAGGWEE